VNWSDARDRSLEQWQTILASIGRRDPGELIAWVNAAYGLCEKAREIAERRGEADSICRLCVAYQTQGGCLETRELLASALMAGDWARARALVESLIVSLRDLELSEVQNLGTS
jgi:hypothetical protein